jgi:hypothetical protein
MITLPSTLIWQLKYLFPGPPALLGFPSAPATAGAIYDLRAVGIISERDLVVSLSVSSNRGAILKLIWGRNHVCNGNIVLTLQE